MSTTRPGREPTSASSDFLVRFGLSAVGVVTLATVLRPLRTALTTFTVSAVQSLSPLVGLRPTTGVGGLMIFSTRSGDVFAYRVIEECAAGAVIGLFAVGVLSVPGVATRRRALGFAVGSLALIAVNAVRLVNLAWIGVHHTAFFELAHVWLWQGVVIVAVVLAWLVWMAWATESPVLRALWRHGPLWFVGGVGAGALLQTVFAYPYSTAVDWSARALQALIDAAPYATLQLVEGSEEWDVQVRAVAMVLAIALTLALAGPAVHARLLAAAVVVPLVFTGHVLMPMFVHALENRLALTPLGGPSAHVPHLVINYAVPVIVPLILAVRAGSPRNVATLDQADVSVSA